MISSDLESVRANLTKLQLGQITPELFSQFYPEIGNVEELMEELLPALDELIRELLAGTIEHQGDDEEKNEEAINLMLRELATTTFIAGRLKRGFIPEESSLNVAITPDAAVEIVRSLLAGQGFSFSFEVKE